MERTHKNLQQVLKANGIIPEPEFKYTELGNAERFAYLYRNQVRFVNESQSWLIYRGGKWQQDTDGEVNRLAKAVIRGIVANAAFTNDEEYQAIAKFALSCEKRGKLQAMIGLASYEEGIPLRVRELNRDQWLLNTLNGTIDLRTGQLRHHNPADLISKQIPVEYDLTAPYPTWTQFLHRIMAGNQEKIRLLQQIVGVSLTGDVSIQKLIVFVGGGRNGKSTFLNTLLVMLGDYAKQAEPHLLFAKKSGAHPTGQADLAGARLAICSESNDGHSFDEAVVKRLTGGDRIKARYIGRDFFEFDPTHKLILATNHRPIVRGTDKGIWRRLLLIPFDQTISNTERDDQLPAKLRAELPGILTWAVQGCLDWQENGLVIPASIEQAAQDYYEEMDTIGMFIQEQCETGAGLKIEASVLYQAYQQWAKDRGEVPFSGRRLGESMSERGFQSRRSGPKGGTERYGIALR